MKLSRGYWGLVVMITASLALAQTQIEPVATRPGDEAAALIAPFVDDQTIVVAHADVAKIDTAAALAFVQKILPQIDNHASSDTQKQLVQARATAEGFLAAYRQAGGRHAFYVMAHSDVWPAMKGGAVLIPLEAGHDPQIMMALLKPICGSITSVVLKGNVIAIGPQAPINRLKEINASPRPDVTQALGSAPTSTVQVMVTPTADNRRVIREMMSTLPPEFGGGSADFIYDGLAFVSMNLMWPPELEVAVRMEFTSPAYALRAQEAIKQAVARGLEKTEVKEMLARSEAQALREYVAFVSSPKINGTTLSYIANENTLTDIVIKVLAPSLERAREQARHLVSASNIRQLLLACFAMQNDSKGWPENLEALNQPYLGGNLAKLGVNPNDDKHRPYIYRKPSAEELKKNEMMSLPVIWEQVDDDALPVNVGFADGHVEMFKSRAELQKAFERAGIVTPLKKK